LPGLSEAFERIGTALERHLEVSHAAGAALAVTDRDRILGVVVRGMADAASNTPVRPETRFQIGSISKSFAAIVALQEAEAGRLDLHQSINEILPWAEVPEPYGPITLHHLLSHTSGLRVGPEEAPSALGAAATLRQTPPTFAPGEHFWYSNDGYKLVGLALEQVTGLPIHQLLLQRMLDPLGMSASSAAITDEVRRDLATGYDPLYSDRPARLTHPLVPASWAVYNTADGSIVSNVIDMAAYARLLLRKGEGILSGPMFALFTTPHAPYEDEPNASYGYGMGMGSDRHGRWLAHGGGMIGYTALLCVWEATGLGVVMLQNGRGGKVGLADHTHDVVQAALVGSEPPEPWVPPSPTRIVGAEQFAGVYEGEDGSALRVDCAGDGLVVAIHGTSARLERDPLEEQTDSFLVAHQELERFPLRFGRDSRGEVVEAFHGDVWFRGAKYEGPAPKPASDHWRACSGVYRSNNPWAPVMRIVLRKGNLELQWPTADSDEFGGELTELEDGWFAVGETWTPRRIRFDLLVNGRAVVAEYNSGRWYRSFEN
jgi:CubicO group peptidase (beta-lactamase class C family)